MGINTYKDTRKATFNYYSPRIFSMAIDYTRGENRAESYRSILTDQNLSVRVKLIAIYALLTGKGKFLKSKVMDQINNDPGLLQKISIGKGVSALKNTIIQLGVDEHTLSQISASLVRETNSDVIISKEKILKAFGGEPDVIVSQNHGAILTQQEGQYLANLAIDEQSQRYNEKSQRQSRRSLKTQNEIITNFGLKF